MQRRKDNTHGIMYWARSFVAPCGQLSGRISFAGLYGTLHSNGLQHWGSPVIRKTRHSGKAESNFSRTTGKRQ